LNKKVNNTEMDFTRRHPASNAVFPGSGMRPGIVRIFVISILALSGFFGSSFAAQQDSLRQPIPADSIVFGIDSLKASPHPAAKNIPRLKTEYYSLDGKAHPATDSVTTVVHDFRRLLHLNYNGMADVFRNTPAYQIYDFNDMGIPRYVAGIGLLPHQTAVQMDGHVLNDPVSGLYNTRFISLEEVRQVEADPTTAASGARLSRQLDAVNVVSRPMVVDEPYTRLMFRQGDFGYSDLDIDFARRINPQSSIQLGGVSKYYDLIDYRGVQYRAALNYQIAGRIFSRTRLNMNRERTWSRNISEYEMYHYAESRDDAFSDLTWRSAADTSDYWHFAVEGMRARRTNYASVDTFHARYRFDRFTLSVERRQSLLNMVIFGGAALSQTAVWGSALDQKYEDSEGQAFLRMEMKPLPGLMLYPAIRYQYSRDLQIDASLHSLWLFSRGQIKALIGRFSRAPLRNETSVQNRSFSGNHDLKDENNLTILLSGRYNVLPSLAMESQAGQRRIEDEIVFDGEIFRNTSERVFSFVTADLYWTFWRLNLSAGGMAGNGDVQVAPKASFHSGLIYHDNWLNGRIIIDATANFYWFDRRRQMLYNPIVERFYWGAGESPAYTTFSYKLAATVKDAQFYLAMDNPLSYEYSVIQGYYEYYRRVQFGLNWVLWD
jgi:hypothetical protein